MQVQQIRAKTCDRALQQPGERGTDRRIQPLSMAGRERDFDITCTPLEASMLTRIGVSQHGDRNIRRRQRRTQIRAGALDAAGMWRKKFADMQNAHSIF